jgi:excisionase family DNA binding protein
MSFWSPSSQTELHFSTVPFMGGRSTEAAHMLSLSVVSLRRLIKSGTIRAHRKTRHILISRSEIERFAAA